MKPIIEPIGWLRTLQFVATDACVSGETTPTGSRRIPFATVGGHGAVERAGLEDQHRGIIQVRAASDV